jgi:hypothetical protein
MNSDNYQARLARAAWDQPHTQQAQLTDTQVDALVSELSSATDRETFNSIMARFDAEFIGKHSATIPARPPISVPTAPTLQPFSPYDGLYQGTQRPPMQSPYRHVEYRELPSSSAYPGPMPPYQSFSQQYSAQMSQAPLYTSMTSHPPAFQDPLAATWQTPAGRENMDYLKESKEQRQSRQDMLKQLSRGH